MDFETCHLVDGSSPEHPVGVLRLLVDSLEPSLSLFPVAAQPPEPAHGTHKTQGQVILPSVKGPSERAPNVVMFLVHLSDPDPLLRSSQVRFGGFGQLGEVLGMPMTRQSLFVRLA